MDLDNIKKTVIKHLDTQIRTNNLITMLEQTFRRIMNSRVNLLANISEILSPVNIVIYGISFTSLLSTVNQCYINLLLISDSRDQRPTNCLTAGQNTLAILISTFISINRELIHQDC